MTLKYRRIIYILAILIFVIFTPILIIYAMGYNYNFKKNKFEETGMLFIKTKQNDIKIYINGELYENKVKKYSFIPKTILSKIEYSSEMKIPLLPNEYNIKIQKEGYWPWKKNIIIEPNLTAFTPDLKLFKKTIPIKLQDGNFKNLTASKANSDILYMADSAASSTNLVRLKTDENIKILYKAPIAGNPSYRFSANKERVLLEQGKSYFVIDPLSPSNTISLQKITSHKLKNVKWDQSNDYVLYAEAEKTNILYKIDLIKSKAEPINKIDCIDYTINSDGLFIIARDKEKKQLLLKLVKNDEEKIIAALPYSEKTKFLSSGNSKYLMLKDFNAVDAYIIDPFTENLSEMTTNLYGLNQFQWNSNKDLLLYSNNFEIWIYDLNKNKKRLITRLSAPIKQTLYFGENNIIFTTGSTINIIESSLKINKNYTPLLSANKIDEIILNETAGELYFSGQIGMQTGLFFVELF